MFCKLFFCFAFKHMVWIDLPYFSPVLHEVLSRCHAQVSTVPWNRSDLQKTQNTPTISKTMVLPILTWWLIRLGQKRDFLYKLPYF